MLQDAGWACRAAMPSSQKIKPSVLIEDGRALQFLLTRQNKHNKTRRLRKKWASLKTEVSEQLSSMGRWDLGG